MKKISLQDVKNGLRRDELRAISGGYGSSGTGGGPVGGGGNLCESNCTNDSDCSCNIVCTGYSVTSGQYCGSQVCNKNAAGTLTTIIKRCTC